MADDLHRIELQAGSVEELRSFLDGAAVDLGCRPVVRKAGDNYSVDIYAALPTIERLRSARSAAGVTVTVIENASAEGRARQTEVGSGNRFVGRIAPSGIGIKE